MTKYWFCLKHHAVEGPDGCDYKDRLGPYETEAEAARALEKVKERNEAWDNDPQWNDDARGLTGGDPRDRRVSPWALRGHGRHGRDASSSYAASGLVAPWYGVGVLLAIWAGAVRGACRWLMPHPRRTLLMPWSRSWCGSARSPPARLLLDWTA